MMTTYNLKTLKLPKLTGTALKIFTAAIENPLGRALLLGSLLENGGIPKLRRVNLQETPTLYPLVQPNGDKLGAVPFKPDPVLQNHPFLTVRDYAEAYRNGKLDPVEVAEKVLAALETDNQQGIPLKVFVAVNREDVLNQARIAAQRLRSGQSIGLLDGVPVAVKDEIDMVSYHTRVGTRIMGTTPAVEDSTVVARLRTAGALLIGKTNMHEIGINPNGYNAHYGAVCNPWDVQRDPGGSSSGSAAAVAAGFVPLAVGADGGGSIRIPASLCGIVGLKATFGRVSEFGAAPLGWSLVHLGPLAACLEDAALGYAIMAGPDPREPNSLAQPPVNLADWNRADLQGVRIGVDKDWFNHAAPGVVKVCLEMLEKLRSAGAEVINIAIPELDEMRIAHTLTILSEMAICLQSYRGQRGLQGYDVRLSLALAESLFATDYLQAQRMRTRALAIFREIFHKVDVIISPATALTAQLIPTNGRACGWSDLGTETEMMRFACAGNLTGLPAISFPAGYDENGLPVGMQAMGRHWEEHLLLRVAYNAGLALERRNPERYYRIH
jgi:Asp-tRNA(Asn)/Glu-tRNA(Gln) amidotransferase A subunit family amidase